MSNYEIASPWMDKVIPTPAQITDRLDWLENTEFEYWPYEIFSETLYQAITIAPAKLPRLFSTSKTTRRRIPFLTIEGAAVDDGPNVSDIDRPGRIIRRYVDARKPRVLSDPDVSESRYTTTSQGLYVVLNIWRSDSFSLRKYLHGRVSQKLSYLAALPGPHLVCEDTSGNRLELTLEQTATHQRIVARAASAIEAANLLRSTGALPLAHRIDPKPYDLSRFSIRFTVSNVPIDRSAAEHHSRWVRLWFKCMIEMFINRQGGEANEFVDIDGLSVMRRYTSEEDAELFQTLEVSNVFVIVSGEDEIRIMREGSDECGMLTVVATSDAMVMLVALKGI